MCTYRVKCVHSIVFAPNNSLVEMGQNSRAWRNHQKPRKTPTGALAEVPCRVVTGRISQPVLRTYRRDGSGPVDRNGSHVDTRQPGWVPEIISTAYHCAHYRLCKRPVPGQCRDWLGARSAQFFLNDHLSLPYVQSA